MKYIRSHCDTNIQRLTKSCGDLKTIESRTST